MELSKEAKNELKEILSINLPKQQLDQLTESNLNELGVVLLKLTSVVLKH